jgi:transcription elongation factor GreA
MDKHHAVVVEVGTTVVIIKKGTKEEKQITIVGSEEANSLENKISNEAPLGKALLGKKKGDSVVATTPKGEVSYTIKSIA